jgi:hypothetical protein
MGSKSLWTNRAIYQHFAIEYFWDKILLGETDKTGTCDGTYNASLPLTKNIFLVLKLFTHKQFTLLHSIYIGDILGFCRAVRNASQQWREANA